MENNTIKSRLEVVRNRIAQGEHRSQRPPGTVLLLATSKGQPIESILAAHAAGQRHFGESYLQEALPKIGALDGKDIEWHYIGPLQSNKTRQIAEHFAWVHSVDKAKIAERLNNQRPENLPPLNICIQINVSDEQSKSGIAIDELPHLLPLISRLPRLKLRGLMTIPAPSTDFEDQRKAYRVLHEALQRLVADGWQLDTLSMGMSGDLEAAIAEGATIVRIGTAIFGERG